MWKANGRQRRKSRKERIGALRTEPIASFRAEPFLVPRLGARRFLFAISCRLLRLQGMKKSGGDGGNPVDSFLECGLIGFGRLRITANLANKLQRRGANLTVGRGRIEVKQRLDIPAHGLVPR